MTGDPHTGEIGRLPAGQPCTQRFHPLERERAVCLVHVMPSESKPVERAGRCESQFSQPGMSRTVFAIDRRHDHLSRMLKRLAEDAGAVSTLTSLNDLGAVVLAG